MPRIVVLFNLKPGVDPEEYERWALETDLPTVRALGSVDGFSANRVSGLLTGGAAPYRYVEVIDVNDMDVFGADISSETMQKVAAQFQAFTENPQFMLAEALD